MATNKYRILALAVCLFSLGVLFLLLSMIGPVEARPLLQEPPEERGEDEEVEGAEVLPATVVDEAFTYQGRLTDSSGSPVSDGVYDFEVELYNGPDPSDPGTTQVGATIAVTDVVSNGLFNLTLPVTHGDFNGQGLYLRMRVRPSGGTWDDWTGTQPILPVPYALSLRPGAIIGGPDAGSGILWLRDTSDRNTILLNGFAGILQAGASGQDGDLFIASSAGNTALQFDGDTAELTLGTSTGGNPGDLIIRDNAGDNAIRLEGSSGDVYADGGYHCGPNIGAGLDGIFSEAELDPCLSDNSPADFAEVLPVAKDPETSDVLVIGRDGQLTRSTEPYQTSVVGVYSTRPSYIGGARNLGKDDYAPLAIMGIVPCKVSAENGAIVPGDLLTTSSTAGHAMRAGDNPAPGTVLGKALGELEEGTGTIEVLVTLQ